MINMNSLIKTLANILLPLTKAGVEKAIDNHRDDLKVGVEVDTETGGLTGRRVNPNMKKPSLDDIRVRDGRQRIVFLDYDGVVRSWYSDLVYGWATIDPSIAYVLHMLQDVLGLTYVCSSRAWGEDSREAQEMIWAQTGWPLKFHEDFCTEYHGEYTRERWDSGEFDAMCCPEGLVEYHRRFDFLRERDPERDVWYQIQYWRGFSVLKWLEAHPEITNNDWLVIDDESDMYPLPLRNFVHVVNGEQTKGLGWEHLRYIIEFFTDEVDGARMLDYILAIKQHSSNINQLEVPVGLLVTEEVT